MRSKLQPLPWSEQVREQDSRSRTAFLESHLDLVRYLALRIAARLPASVELDDLINDGTLGLLDAVEKYDPGRGVQFRSYAESRIRGAILDGLRHKDWRPRSIRAMQRKLDETVGMLASSLHRPADEEELAGALGLELESYRSVLRDVAAGPLLSLDEFGSELTLPAERGRPDEPLEQQDLIRTLGHELTRLPERERHVLELYYHEQLNMKEVGAVLGITESRVCQLHAQAAARLRAALNARLHASPRAELAGTGRQG